MSAENALKKDFRLFLGIVWRHLNLPKPDPIQMEIADYLQNGPTRKIIMAYRGTGKTWVTAAFVVWKLYCEPDTKILVISATDNFAGNIVRFMKSIIEGIPQLRHMVPEGDAYRWSSLQFDVAGTRLEPAPSVRAASITGQITGSRADLIIADDVEIPRNSATQVMREKLQEITKELDSIITPKKTSTIAYLGTPHTEDTLYMRLQDRGYKARVWPARFPTDPDKYAGTLSPSIFEAIASDPELKGKPTEPRRFGEMFLSEKELSIGRSTFALQFLLDPRLSDLEKYPLKVSDLIIMGLDQENTPEKIAWSSGRDNIYPDLPNLAMTGDYFHKPMGVSKELVPYTGSVMVIDPSGRGKDETGYCVAKVRNSQIFIMASGGLSGGYSEATLRYLALVAKSHKVNRIIIEANFGDGMFEALLKPMLRKIYPVTTEEVKASTKQFKEARIIDILEPVMNQHRLVIDPSVIRKDYETIQSYPPEQQRSYSLVYQMTRITRERGALLHDDRLDALAWAVWYWTQAMGLDVDTEMAEEERRRLEAVILEMENGLHPEFSSAPPPNSSRSWIQL